MAQGEARPIQVALDRLDPRGVIASDCLAAVCLWLKADRHKADDCIPLWDYQRAYEQHPRHQDSVVKWIPAHRTFQEAIEGGMCYEDWAGNGMADSIAKWAAREGGPTADLATARAKQRLQSEAVLRAAGTVLLQRLKARPRTKEDTAIKARKRPPPAFRADSGPPKKPE